ncbi:MAG: 16S rRNA (cytosine(1402)-N(4))-methyltransferase RsmH [Oscillospiraceae bacterium]|nr:16S rRNA (cytosine(1402)-N(4))-methyltransferase RsmH [Oscillospiraceae bacterium]
MKFSHYSVLLSECLEGLAVKPDGVYVDATAGGAGHSVEIAKRLEGGRLYSFDQDPDAVAAAGERLRPFPGTQVVQSNFREMEQALAELGVYRADGVLFDLGVSSFQLDTASRGFSYRYDAPLDMRMSRKGLTAAEVVNRYSEEELTRILREYGEEKFARQIARNLLRAREQKEIKTTFELSEIVKASMPAKARRDKNPSKRTFQALRIEVNGELDSLSEGLDQAFALLKPGGRLAVISFHSLEDRMVKQRFASWCRGCTCPPEFPVCVCGNRPKAKLVSKKPILPSERELKENTRSQSAKLRILEKL